MSEFEQFIYMFGAIAFAVAIPTAMFLVVGKIEQPRRRRR